MSTDLAALFAPNKTITIGGIEFQIREFIAAEFPMVAALGNRLTDLDLTGIGPLFETESERVFALIASVTGRPLADIKQLRMTILVELLGAIIEENLPFFVQALGDPLLLLKTFHSKTCTEHCDLLSFTKSRLPLPLSVIALPR